MANDLIWRPIDIPRLDTRDMMYSGQVINNAFSRFNDLLAERDAQNRKDATDEAAAKVLAANDANAINAIRQQVLNGTLGDRVDARQIAALANTRSGQITEQAANQAQLEVSQAKAAKEQDLFKHGDLYQQALNFAEQGDYDNANKVLAGIKANGGGQAAYDVGIDINKAFDAHRSYLLDKARTDASVMHDNVTTRLASEQAAQLRNDRNDLIAGDKLGVALAEQLRLQDPDTAMASFQESDAFKALPAAAREQAKKSFSDRYGALTAPTGATNKSLGSVSSKISVAQNALDANINRAKNDQLSSLAKATRMAAEDQPDIGANDVITYLHTIDPAWSRGGTTAEYEKMLEGIKGKVRPEDVLAAAKVFGTKAGFWQTINPVSNGDFYTTLGKRVQEIVNQREKGYGQNEVQDLAIATAHDTATKDELTRLQSDLVRFERARMQQPGQQLPPDAAAQEARTRARLTELLSKTVEKPKVSSTGSW